MYISNKQSISTFQLIRICTKYSFPLDLLEILFFACLFFEFHKYLKAAQQFKVVDQICLCKINAIETFIYYKLLKTKEFFYAKIS